MGLKYSWRFLILVFVAFHGFTFAEKAPNFSFVKEATSAPAVSYYDYIVVGGGTAGFPLAATLSQNANVLVLERGSSPYANTTKLRAENFINTLKDSSPNSVAQAFISEDGVSNSRARALGGGTVINGGFYSRGEELFVKENGLDEALVRDSYEWVERKLVYKPKVLQWQSAMRDGLLEAGVLPYNRFTFDHIIGTKIGGTIFDRNGNRHTAADLLEYADAKKIKVYLHALVNKIIFIKGGPRAKAQGVIFYDAKGGKHTAFLKKDSRSEIILSAGTIGSPQLLLVSGVGPSSKLEPLGIEVVVNQPNVGQGITDNPASNLLVPSPTPLEISVTEVVGISKFGHYIESISGFDYVALSSAQIQIGERSKGTSSNNVGSILEKISRPISRGYLELQSSNMSENPKVRFNYYQRSEDLRSCVRGMETIIKVVNSKSFATIRPKNTTAEDLLKMTMMAKRINNPNTTISLEQYCLNNIHTMYHYHGSCRVGKVVDGDYKVIGVDGLRVIDASILNFAPGTNPQATIMMLGRYMGRIILQSRRRG